MIYFKPTCTTDFFLLQRKSKCRVQAMNIAQHLTSIVSWIKLRINTIPEQKAKMQRGSRSWLFSQRLFLSFQRHHVVVNLLQTAVDECHAKVFACRELVREKQGLKCFKEAKQCDTCAEYIELITVGQISLQYNGLPQRLQKHKLSSIKANDYLLYL